MFPFIFEWHWTIDRLIFMGLLYLVLTIVGLGLLTALLMTFTNMQKNIGGHGVEDPAEASEH
jgi:hypothetical protein